jgi:Mn2+/Fe2+ NRAMP family transporter
VVVAMALVLVPGAPLVPILFLSQALNAVLLLPLLVLSYGIATDRFLMGDHVLARAGRVATLAVIALVGGCLAALAALSIA